MKKIFLFLVVLSNSVFAQTTIFSQDFSSSSLVADYDNFTTPNTGQFNIISLSGLNSSASISGGRLRFLRSLLTTNVGVFARTTDLTPTPSIIFFKFDLQVSDVESSKDRAAVIQVGSNFGTSAAIEPNTDVHSQFAIGLATFGFRLRNLELQQNANLVYSSNSRVTFVVNNSSSTYTYVAPNGNQETIAPDTWDLFVGVAKQFDDAAALTPGQELTDFKFVFDDGAGTILFDNFLIESVNPLPIQLSSFTAQAIDKTILLNWETLSETENASFEIERSVDGISFTKIGSKEGSGITTALTKYRFVDENPLPGTNYYRLKQIDIDGKSEISVVRSAISNISFATLSVLQNSNTVTAQILSPVKEKAKLSLFDISGKVLAQQDVFLERGLNQFDFSQNLVSGIYFFKLTSASNQVNTKFVKP